ncbi:MAG: metallophosphoesterase family protein [Candidatus Gracilibacteria bacterium]|nr:metallophosphoesterase family protein [Candidatus Gracilibacteria bacterium]MDD5178772.1 metallophosphoesterase family protein [Candidatus Gracilibacteria bacterium]
MRIALLSDSHGGLDRLETALSNLANSEITNVFHAGDFLADGMSELLGKFPSLKIFIARGNCDVGEEEWGKVKPLPNVIAEDLIETEIAGKKIVMSHRPLTPPPCDFYFFGHTHRPEICREGNTWKINPGALFESGIYAIVNLENAEVKPQRFDKAVGV